MANELQKSDDSEQRIDGYSLKSNKLNLRREISELSNKIRPSKSLIDFKFVDYKFDEEFKVKGI